MPTGRPRKFERAVALRCAMEVFWDRGYQGASVSVLTDAMGINSPSLYATFGSKAALFTQAADLYQSEEGADPRQQMDNAPTARLGVELFLRANVHLFTRAGRPHGCLLTRAVATLPPDDEEVRQYLARSTRGRLKDIRDRAMRARDAGEPLPFDDLTQLTGFYDALVQGLAIRAQEGASRRALEQSVDAAMAAWDGLLGRSGVNAPL